MLLPRFLATRLLATRLLAVLLLAAPFSATPASAATLAGVSLPDTYPVAGQTLVLNGIGLRSLTIFNVHVYVAGLYLARQSHNPAEILASPGAKVILLSFVHSASKAQVEKQFRTGEENNCRSGACDPADAPDFERLDRCRPGRRTRRHLYLHLYPRPHPRPGQQPHLSPTSPTRTSPSASSPASSATTPRPPSSARNCSACKN